MATGVDTNSHMDPFMNAAAHMHLHTCSKVHVRFQIMEFLIYAVISISGTGASFGQM